MEKLNEDQYNVLKVHDNTEQTFIYNEKIKSYLTKDEFVQMISMLDFKYIKSYNIDFVTGFIINLKDEEKNFKPLGYNLKLDDTWGY